MEGCLIVLAEASESVPLARDGVTQSQLLLAIGALVGCVVFLWKWNEAKTVKQIEEAKADATKAANEAKQAAEVAQQKCEEDRTRLISRLDEKDSKIERLHLDARDVVTIALTKGAEADTKVAASLSELAANQREFTETLRSVKCLHQSGEHRAV